MAKQKTAVERELALRVGGRIRQLRAIQHVSQIRLATEVGIRAGPLGWIEKGLHLPSGRVLYRIAKQLNVRIDDLFQDANIWQPGATAAAVTATVMLPPLAVEAGAEAVKAAHIVCQSVADTLRALEVLCGAVATPSLPLELPFPSAEAGVVLVAEQVRRGLGLGSLITRDYLELFEGAGLRVVFMDMPEGCESFCGYDRANRNAAIFLNSLHKRRPERQLYRMVFELGRVLWHARAQHGAGTEEAKSADESVLDEGRFAQRFAIHFLLPAGAVQATVWQMGISPTGWSFEALLRLKRRYGVSAEQFAQRLQELKLSWSDRQKKSPRHYLFKDVIESFCAENGPAAEPGGSGPQLAMNGRLCDLLLNAEQKAGKNQKPVGAIKRALRQAGVKLDG